MKIPFLGILASLFTVYLTHADSRSEDKNINMQSCLNTWRTENSLFPEDIIDTFSMALSDTVQRSLFICDKNECGEAGNCFWNIMQPSHEKCYNIGIVEGFPYIDTIKHDGYRDIETTWHLSASERIITLYQFQSNQYRNERSYDCLIDSRRIEVRILIEKNTINSDSTATIIKPDSTCIKISFAHIRPGTYKDLFVFVPDDCNQANQKEGYSYIFIQSNNGYFMAGCIPGVPYVLKSRKNGYFELETIKNNTDSKKIYSYNGKIFAERNTLESK